jgi:hypothetical protein
MSAPSLERGKDLQVWLYAISIVGLMWTICSVMISPQYWALKRLGVMHWAAYRFWKPVRYSQSHSGQSNNPSNTPCHGNCQSHRHVIIAHDDGALLASKRLPWRRRRRRLAYKKLHGRSKWHDPSNQTFGYHTLCLQYHRHLYHSQVLHTEHQNILNLHDARRC